MKVTVLGSGTSQGVPIISCKCKVCTSDNPKDNRLRASVLVESEGKTIVIDAGPDFRQQMLRENVCDIDAIIVTHEHRDHISGLDDIRPLNFLNKKDIDIFAETRVQNAIKAEFHYAFADKKYPGVP
ncbi:MAG: MBL fold metallo-hydrolase, partial [Bacteroidota bacterium]|nr:MBL fold metallo-hydrolase [Bacteroidota bacterium]